MGDKTPERPGVTATPVAESAGTPVPQAGDAAARAKAAAGAPVETLARIWARIKEHKVLQWTLAYLAAALALAHGAELVSEGFEWPHAVFRAVIALLALGLPIVVALSWYHGHKGLRRISQGEALIVSLLLIICSALLVVFVRPAEEHARTQPSLPGERVSRASGSGEGVTAPESSASRRDTLAPVTAGKPRIAVLPFENLSPDPANAFFADGLHEEILSALANSGPGMEVISRTTMMTYRGKGLTLEKVANELGATHVLEGSVRRDGDDVRVTLQLIDARNDDHVWARNYDRKLIKVMTLQSEVAGEVAQQLSVKLAPAAQSAGAPTSDVAAYDLYLKARLARQLLSGAATLEAWREVESLFGEAIARDGSFALAYAERASVRFFMFITNFDTTAENLARARADIEAARRLAPGEPVTLAAESISALIDQDYERALALFQSAEAAGLSDPNMMVWKSNILLERDQGFEEALRVLEEAAALDPGNPYVYGIWTGILILAQRPAEALRVISIAQARQPDNPTWQGFSGGVRMSFTATPAQDDVSFQRAQLENVLGVDGQLPDVAVVNGFQGIRLGFVSLLESELAKFIEKVPETVRVASIATFFPFSVGRMPSAAFLGWSHLVAGDTAAAAQDGAAVLAFVAAQEETKWNRWFLHLLSAQGHVFRGERAAAEREAREALKHISAEAHYTNWRFANYRAAQVLAWTGAKDEAVTMLEQLNGPGGLAPAYITRDPVFTVPLADNARYRALKAKLEAQMAALKLE